MLTLLSKACRGDEMAWVQATPQKAFLSMQKEFEAFEGSLKGRRRRRRRRHRASAGRHPLRESTTTQRLRTQQKQPHFHAASTHEKIFQMFGFSYSSSIVQQRCSDKF